MAKSWSKNNKLNADQVLPKAKGKYLWTCDLGHEWDESPHVRSARDYTCPICSGKRVLEGFNDLRTTHPDLEESWSLKNTLKITEVSHGSSKKAIWFCDLNHEWESRIERRVSGGGCPYCVGKAISVGYNDLASLRPDIAAQWSSKNELRPTEVTIGASFKALWDCAKGHTWRSSVNSRIAKKSGCLICIGKEILVGFNDFQTLYPNLATEWSEENSLKPTEITRSSSRKIKWKCTHGHKWIATAGNRTLGGTDCPTCVVSKTEEVFIASFTKQTGFDFVSTSIPLIRDLYINKRAQVDGLCEELKIAVEYDGQWSHGNTVRHGKAGDGDYRLLRDASTTEALLNAGYRVIRIREHSLKGKLRHVEINVDNLATPELASNLYQVTYKSFGKMGERDEIDDVVKSIVAAKSDWFNK